MAPPPTIQLAGRGDWALMIAIHDALRCAERRSLRLVNSANHHSTRFIHEALVGVKRRRKRGWRNQPPADASVLWVA